MYTEEKIVLEKLFNLSSQLSFTKQTMLYLIGLGLSYESDITVRGLETVKKCKRVYLEAYTSILMAANQESLEKFYGREIILADRELVDRVRRYFERCRQGGCGIFGCGRPIWGHNTHRLGHSCT